MVGQDLEDCYYRGKTAMRENMLIPLLHEGEFRDGCFTHYLILIFENGKITITARVPFPDQMPLRLGRGIWLSRRCLGPKTREMG